MTAWAAPGYEALWDRATLYRGEGNGAVDSLALSGRLQAEAVHFDGRRGEDFDDALWRRFRFGFKAGLTGGWVLQLEGDFDLNKSPGDWYQRLTDAYIGWQPDESLDLRLLKHSAGFTLDGATSSKKLLTLQRNNLTNNLWFTAEYFTGASLTGKAGKGLSYRVGVFSSDGSDEIGITGASYFSLTSLGYDLANRLGLELASVRLDFVYNDRHEDANTRDFSRVLSLSSEWQQGRWGLRTDLAAGDGYAGQSDLWGLTLMPIYNATETLQWVLRYTWIDSEDANGVRLPRYHDRVASGRGDHYEESYAGINVFLYGHRLKWQTGLEYAVMDDRAADGGRHEGWGITTGLRLYW